MVRPLVDGFRRFIASQRAESGMGALLIFIASILVAAVAAGVIIQSTYMAQQRAQSTAELSIQDVSDGWKILSVEGEVNETGTALTHIYLKIALHAGSYPLDLNHTVIEITDGTHEANLYLNTSWKPYIYVVYSTENNTFYNITETPKGNLDASELDTIYDPAHYTENDYVIKISTFHIDKLDEIMVYNKSESESKWQVYNGNTIGNYPTEQIKLNALIYAAKHYARPGISYTVVVIRDPLNDYDEHTPNRVVTQGAVLKLFINVTGWNIEPQTHVTIKLMPKHGVPTLEEFWTPPTYARQSYISLT
ncbi:MAG: hypothetical protein J7J75_00020 [Euryarchaeota archaeon]|nr:hypothetical protein [Euryarchaeota archaeon]